MNVFDMHKQNSGYQDMLKYTLYQMYVKLDIEVFFLC